MPPTPSLDPNLTISKAVLPCWSPMVPNLVRGDLEETGGGGLWSLPGAACSDSGLGHSTPLYLAPWAVSLFWYLLLSVLSSLCLTRSSSHFCPFHPPVSVPVSFILFPCVLLFYFSVSAFLCLYLSCFSFSLSASVLCLSVSLWLSLLQSFSLGGLCQSKTSLFPSSYLSLRSPT